MPRALIDRPCRAALDGADCGRLLFGAWLGHRVVHCLPLLRRRQHIFSLRVINERVLALGGCAEATVLIVRELEAVSGLRLDRFALSCPE